MTLEFLAGVILKQFLLFVVESVVSRSGYE
jgi:hypothetical protein